MNRNQETAVETAIQKFDYEGSAIAFANGQDVMVNALQMAKKFGKMPKDWLRLKSTKEFIEALSSERRISLSQLIVVKKGNSGKYDQGTWMHEDVAMEFARWLSPKFAIWCNARIKELARTGVATVAPQPQARTEMEVVAEAFRILHDRVGLKDTRIAQLEAENASLRSAALPTPPAVTYTFTEVAHAIGFERVTDFLNWAVDCGILIRHEGRCIPSRKYRDRGLFWHRSGRGFANPHENRTYSVVTEAGLAMFADELAAFNAEEGGDR